MIEMASRGPACIYINYCGADQTGRDSGGDKINFQNPPRPLHDDNGDIIEGTGMLRRAIEAPEGKILVVGDSANIENRGLVTWAGQQDAIDRFRKKQDPYCFLATKIYQAFNPYIWADREVTKRDKAERFLGKTATLGLGYQMAAEKFLLTCAAQGVKITPQFANLVVEIFRDTYDRVEKLWGVCGKSLEDIAVGRVRALGESVQVVTGPNFILLPSGRHIRYPNLRHEKNAKTHFNEWQFDGRKGSDTKIYGGKVVENVIQALARDVVLEQADEIHRILKRVLPPQDWADMVIAGTEVAMRVHDEVVCCVPEEYADATKKIMEEVMSQPPVWWPTLPVACEVDYGTNYRDAKP
jgi:DNA polymerase